MVTIIAAITVAVTLTCIVLMRGRQADPGQLSEPRTALLTVGVQIICGNCSGEGEHAIRTYLDRRGNCSQCGGRSYLLASWVAANGAVLRGARLREAHLAARQGRVIPFASRSERIAV
jgi:DnaJ-class molecular chaperone